MIKPTRNNIQFDFIENVVNGGFNNSTDWGFEIRNRVEDVKVPRWGVVHHVGDDVKNVKVGEYILIQPLMWTENLKVDDINYRFTSEEKVLLHTKDKPIGIN